MNRQEAVRRATELVEQMSVEELASQLRFDADEIPHLDIPEYNWWNEGLHGVARAGTATVFHRQSGLEQLLMKNFFGADRSCRFYGGESQI